MQEEELVPVGSGGSGDHRASAAGDGSAQWWMTEGTEVSHRDGGAVECTHCQCRVEGDPSRDRGFRSDWRVKQDAVERGPRKDGRTETLGQVGPINDQHRVDSQLYRWFRFADDGHCTGQCRCDPDGDFQERQLTGAPKSATASAIKELRLASR
jgi:hypothetical protein